jgi:hypothetical protein
MSEECPDNAGSLVGQRDRYDVWMTTWLEALKPIAWSSLRAGQHRPCAKDEQPSQIPVSSFADPKQPGLAAGDHWGI